MLVYELKDKMRPIIADLKKQTPLEPKAIQEIICLAVASVLYEQADPTAEVQDEL